MSEMDDILKLDAEAKKHRREQVTWRVFVVGTVCVFGLLFASVRDCSDSEARAYQRALHRCESQAAGR